MNNYQIRRAKCIYHQTEFVTNYCKVCNVVLCPSCVGDHSFSHDSAGTRAEYQNINDTISGVRQKLLRSIKQFSQEKIILQRLIKSSDLIPGKIRQKVEEAKRLAWQKISQSFDKLEQQILEYTISSDIKKCTSLHARIEQLMQGQFQCVQTLKTQEFAQTLLQFISDDYQKYQAEKLEIQKFIDSVKMKAVPQIQINGQSVAELTSLVSKSLVVRYYKPKTTQSEKPTQEYHSNSISQNPIKAKSSLTKSNVYGSVNPFEKGHQRTKAPMTMSVDQKSYKRQQGNEFDYQAIIQRIKNLESSGMRGSNHR